MESNERKRQKELNVKMNEPRAPDSHMSMEVMNVHTIDR